jgi:tripartite-type tricarboxylate transporter receptor subunit TctC
VIVENRTGANALLATETVARAEADGYTLLFASLSHNVNRITSKEAKYHPVKDFAPITLAATLPLLLVTHPGAPFNSVRELIALAKAKPGHINFASSGTGGTPHLCSELFKLQAGIDMTHVPYKGAGVATIDVVGGQVQMFCTGLTALTGLIRSGKVRALGIASLQRSPQMPELPTISEQGLPGFEVNSWTGVAAPAKTPAAIVRRLHAEIVAVVNDADMKNFLLSQGAEPALLGPEEFRDYIRADIAKWAKVIKAAGIRIE